MTKATAFITAFALTFALPASHATASPANLLMEEHRSEAGYQVDLYVTEGPEGVLSEATLTEPDTGESVDVWTDGTTVWWDGVVDGSHVNGSALVTDFDRGPQAFCAGPVAIVCIGVVIVATRTRHHLQDKRRSLRWQPRDGGPWQCWRCPRARWRR